jgi:fermentation-respiration switch protein FrsA (DUF1100 family)
VQDIRIVGQIFLLRYAGKGTAMHPVGLNLKLDTNHDGKLEFASEVRPVYEAFFRHLAHPLSVVRQYAHPTVLPLAVPFLTQSETLDGRWYDSFMSEPADQTLRVLRGLPHRPRVLIVNGANDDQTPASSAELLAQGLARTHYAVTVHIYPGLSHALSPQATIFAPYGYTLQPQPLHDIGAWLVNTLGLG